MTRTAGPGAQHRQLARRDHARARPAAELAEDLAGAERDPDRIAAVARADVDAALLEPLEVQGPGIHERLDREPLHSFRDVFDRNGSTIAEPATDRLHEARHPEVADLADIEQVVDELGPADHRR